MGIPDTSISDKQNFALGRVSLPFPLTLEVNQFGSWEVPVRVDQSEMMGTEIRRPPLLLRGPSENGAMRISTFIRRGQKSMVGPLTAACWRSGTIAELGASGGENRQESITAYSPLATIQQQHTAIIQPLTKMPPWYVRHLARGTYSTLQHLQRQYSPTCQVLMRPPSASIRVLPRLMIPDCSLTARNLTHQFSYPSHPIHPVRRRVLPFL